MRKINLLIESYCNQLKNPEFKFAYEYLLKFTMRLKGYFVKHQGERFTFGNVSPGYMDFSYFPFYDSYLKEHNLRFGIVLNHKAMSLELWLMGKNSQVQEDFWQIFKTSSWMADYTVRPLYNVLEITLLSNLDFERENELLAQIMQKAQPKIDNVMNYLKAKINSV